MTEPHDAGAAATRDPYRIVLEVGTTLASSLDLDEVVQTIARQVGEALDVQWCDINEYDPVARTMTYVAVWSEELRGVDLEYVGTVVSLDDRPERDAVIRKGDLLETYVDDEDLDPREREVMVQYDEKAVMEMPLTFGGETLGVLGVVESRRDRRFTAEEKELLRLLARPAATAIGNARLFRQQQEQARRLGTLLDASRALAASVDLDEVLSGLARLGDGGRGRVLRHGVRVPAASRRARLPRRALAGTRAARGARRRPGDGVPAGPTAPGSGRSWRRPRRCRSTSRTPALADDRRRAMEDWRQKTCLSLPLRSGGATQGILRLTTTDDERRFTAHELQLLEALAESGGAAVHNARLFRAAGGGERAAARALRRQPPPHLDPRPARRRDGAGGGRREAASPATPPRPACGCATTTACSRPRRVPRDVAGRRARAAGARRRPDRGVASPPSAPAWPSRSPSRTGSRACWWWRPRVAAASRPPSARRCRCSPTWRRRRSRTSACTGAPSRRPSATVSRVSTTTGTSRSGCGRSAAASQRYGTPLSLLMLDLDDFKAFNDQFGHQIGDEALREVGQILFAVTRRGVDLAARYGGEEFAVILPHTRASDAPLEGDGRRGRPRGGAAGRGRRAGRRRAHPRRDRRPRVPGPRRAPLRAHHGHGRAWPSCARTTTPRRSIAAADAALYEGKHAGGDTVVKRGG